jgi:hypothetical protein
MRVFLSWSGKPSKKVAKALEDWLPTMFRGLDIWMSDRGIRVGERWSSDLLTQLDQADFGIVCLTADNINSPWIHFEAGAIAKSVESQTYVAPYLIDIKKKDLRGPLGQFQAARATKKGTWKLVRSLDLAIHPRRRSFRPLEERFKEHWPELKDAIHKAKRSAA